jgi:dTDP-glucose 4,6-dehydratase
MVRLGNLRPTRDLNYVANTVDGFLLAAAKAEAVGQTVNLGCGREISIGDLAQLIAKLVGRSITVVGDEQRIRPEKSEVERLVADNTLARELLGWEPNITLEQGLNSTIEWLRRHSERYRPGVYSI